MQLLQTPFMKLLLKPYFDTAGDASSISITLTLEAPMTRAGKPLYVFTTYWGNVDCYKYKETDLHASDDSGNLPIRFKDGSSNTEIREQLWLVDRNTHGNVTLDFHVYPREVDITTPLGARIDIRRDQGGLLGSGRWFLPRPPTDFLYRHIVEWDLSLAPRGTRTIWTFGEGPAPVEKLGRSDFMFATLYMVGPVQSYPSQPTALTTFQAEDLTGFFWFGQLPANMKRAAKFNHQLFSKMASFFKTPAGPDQTYRVFVRKSLRGYGGSGFESSYALEYDEETKSLPDSQLTELLSHEMVHSWAINRREEGDNTNYWYEEGIADLYATYLPYRFGLSNREYFRNTLNSHLLVYYASPAIHMSDDEAMQNFYTDWSAEKVIYARGSTYLLIIDCAIRRAIRARQEKVMQEEDPSSALETPFDKIIIDLATRYCKGKYFRIGDWLDRIGKYLGRSEAETYLQTTTQGKLTLDIGNIGAELLHSDERLVQVEREQPEIGFEKPAYQARRIEGLVTGSRAARAGLRNGDRIVSAEGVSVSEEMFEKTVKFTVERNGQEIEVEYWPRSFTKVKCWQVVKVGKIMAQRV